MAPAVNNKNIAARIRKGNANDIALLSDLASVTFFSNYRGYSDINESDLKAYVKTAFATERIGEEINDDRVLSLIATVESDPAGYALLRFGHANKDIKAEHPVFLSRLYTVESVHGSGVGQALMNECISNSISRNCDVMWLTVWESSSRARRFYERNGFREIGSSPFTLGCRHYRDLVLKLDLANLAS